MNPQRRIHRHHHHHASDGQTLELLERVAHEVHETHEAQASSSMFQRWMRRWSGIERGGRRSLSEQRRLLAIRRLIAIDLEPHSKGLSQRDLRLYLGLVSAPSLTIVQRLRFDLFDLLCRQIGEGPATVRLHEIDTWLSPRE